jgi:glucose/mannose-6-phosphate isomerase
MNKEDWLKEVSNLASDLNPAFFEERGKELAEKIKDRIPLVYSSARNEGIADNWKVRFNESAKIPAFFNVFPELNHNEMIGFDKKMNDSGLADNFHFIVLKDPEDHPRIAKRMEILEKLLKERDLPIEIIDLEGEGFYKIFSSIVLADWTTYRLAQLSGVDPEQVTLVEEFKKLI